MAKVTLVKRVDLSEFGKDWEGCFIDFSSPSYQEVKEKLLPNKDKTGDDLLDATLDFFKAHYVSSLVPTDEGKRELKAAELGDLPLEVFLKAVGTLTAGASGNPLPSP